MYEILVCIAMLMLNIYLLKQKSDNRLIALTEMITNLIYFIQLLIMNTDLTIPLIGFSILNIIINLRWVL